MSRRRLCYVVASGMTVQAFLREHIRAAAAEYEVTVVANASAAELEGVPARLITVPIERRIAPLADLRALMRLVAVFRRERFDLVHSVTPKAGLLAALAGAIAGVPVRTHTFTGQVWATRAGAGRALLKFLDRLTALLSTRVLADSASQRDFLVAEGVAAADKLQVLGNGSVNGVNAARFHPDADARERVRGQAAVPADAPLFLYLGRLARDKGLLDLARAFATVDGAWLMLVGPDEDGITGEIREACGAAAARLRVLGHTTTPEQFMAAADVFVLPSYREGFGSVILEAAAASVPAIGTRIYGITDAIVEGKTGFLVPVRDAVALAGRMRDLAGDAPLREEMGRAARERALRDFRTEDLTRALLAYYAALPGHAKRTFDLLAAALLLLLFAPVLVLVALLVRLRLGSPVLFLQQRPGRLGRPFRLYKFRTMRDGENLGDAERLTPLGVALRRASLDELPQLYNVLRGEMSLVGPRPLLMEYLPLYSERQAKRHEVLPGITGWAQVNGRNATSWPARFELDVWYVEHRSFGLDLKILWLTLAQVFSGAGVSQPGQATMERFRGNDG